MLICYFFLDRFQLPPNVTLEQDETMMLDLMDHDRQVNYRKWSLAHGMGDDDEVEPEAFDNAPDYKSLN